MRETLRLSPTAPIRTVRSLHATTLVGGSGDPEDPTNPRYEVKEGQMVSVHAVPAMRDVAVWGEDALEWKPERWLQPLPRSVEEARVPGIYANL